MQKIRNFFRNYQDLVVSLVLLLIVVVGILLGVIPGGRATWGLVSQVRETSDKVALLGQKRTQLDSLNESQLREQLVTVVSAVPVDKSIPAIFQVVDQLTAQTGVSVSDMSLVSPGSLATEAAQKQTTEEKALGSSLVPFSVRVSGSFANVRAFLTKITSIRRLVRLRNFDVTFTGGTTAMRLSLDAFYAPLPQLSAKVDQKLSTLTAEENGILVKLSNYPWLSQPLEMSISTSQAVNPFAH